MFVVCPVSSINKGLRCNGKVSKLSSHGRLDSVKKSKTDNFLKLLFNFKSVGDRKFKTFHHSRFIEYKERDSKHPPGCFSIRWTQPT